MKLEKGTTISHYKILSEIGKGGMGEVYLAQDTRLNRKVAIKFLSEAWSKDSDKLNRFIQEAQSASALNHPNIITVFEIDETDDAKYIALEYIEGETLTNRLNKKLKFDSALDIATQIASALDAAHSAGIVHRDIKPDNVMVREDGLVKILDFGIAKLLEKRHGEGETRGAGEEDKTLIAASPDPAISASPKTSPGMIIGTANYMSPEQAKGKDIDVRTDIFSFGVVLYEMVTGELPFTGESPLEIIGSILKDEPKPIENANVSPEIMRLINKALRKDPDERYQTIKGLLVDLKDVKGELEFQDKLEKTIQPNRAEPETQLFKATTAAEAQNTTSTGSVNDSISIKKSSFSKVLMGVAAVFALVAAGIGYWYFASGSEQIDSIAVMPFVNESGDQEVEYLSDGMTESLISSLSNIPNLSVKARSTVFTYKGKIPSPKKIGEELNVDAVLLGRIISKGDELKLNLELVNTATQDVLWSENYTRSMDKLVALQSEIAGSVSAKLRSKLTSSERAQVTKSYTANPEANQLYLKGRFHWNKRKIKDFEKAAQYFERAIELDPGYALAHAGLADTYGLIPQYGNFRPKDFYPRAKQAAQKALQLDNSLAEAHASFANVIWSYEYQWSEAQKGMEKAIELNPSYASAHQWYGELLSQAGNHDKAIKEIEKALDLDPFSRVINRNVGWIYYEAGRYDEALEKLKKAVELYPDDAYGHVHLCDVYSVKKMYDDAIDHCLTAAKIEGVSSEALAEYRAAYDHSGWKGFWLKRIEYRLAEENASRDKKSDYISKAGTAQMYAAAGDKEKTIEYLKLGFSENEPDVIYIRNHHFYDFLKNDAQYKELLRKIGFPGIENDR